MIDYEKLKLAEELAFKYARNNLPRKLDIIISFEDPDRLGFYLQIIENTKLLFDWKFDCSGDLIDKLQELTQPDKPKPRYEVGQEVWVLGKENKCLRTIISAVAPGDKTSYLILEISSWRAENEIFNSRESIIEAQIEYWKSLSAISDGYTPVICQHESDGHKYDKDLPAFDSNGVMIFRELFNKCKKCGEFYK